VGIYEKEPFESYFSGNTIQICPVGALTSAAYRFRSRPFDLISSPSVCEHCASGCALRTDHRRGKVTRRLAADDPAVNEEWNCDKGRFAFRSTTLDDRIRTPLLRDEESGGLRPASWVEAFAVAARGLARAGSSVGVLAGGRLTAEDAYAYGKFARAVIGTNDVDFRARPLSDEEAGFLAAHVAARSGAGYSDLDHANAVLLVGFEAEEESPIVFLRIRKAVQTHGTRVYSIASHTSRGLHKLDGTLLQARPGAEAAAVRALIGDTAVGLDGDSVILVGERAAQSPGALTAVAALADVTGAKLAWIPRRAGERGALEAGLLPTLLPGGRPLADAAARVDLAAAWGVDVLPSIPGRNTDQIVDAAGAGELAALVVGGVDVDDLASPGDAVNALDSVGFLVSLEIRRSPITERADVVLPVSPVTERSGAFVNWEGRLRPFAKALESSALSDLRALEGIAAELGRSLGFRTSAEAYAEMSEIGPWDGERAKADPVEPAPATATSEGEHLLSTWRMLIDDSRGNDGEPYLLATGRQPVAVLSAAALERLGVSEGDSVTVSTEAGAVTVPTRAGDIPDDVVWLPSNSDGVNLLRDLRALAGSPVRVEGGAS
jgi:NADH-quinone oxidoreductase subunit G